jgi:hypothetical protein
MPNPVLTPYLSPEAGGALNSDFVTFMAGARQGGIFGGMQAVNQARQAEYANRVYQNVLNSVPLEGADPAAAMRQRAQALINAGFLPQGKTIAESANLLSPHETYGAPTTIMRDGTPTLALPGSRGNMRIVPGAAPYERGDEAELGRILDQAGIKDPTQRQALFTALAQKKTTHQPSATQIVNTFTPASEEAQKEFMRSARVNYEALRNAPVTLQNIEEAKALIPGAKGFMGPGGEPFLQAAKFLNNRLGASIDVAGIKDAEELRSRLFVGIMDNLKKMDAQPSEMQQRVMMDALGKLGTDPNALPAVLDAYAGVIRGKVDIHNQEVQGAATRGVKFPYDPVIKLPDLQKPGGSAAAPQSFPTPSRAAINRLKMNPKEKSQFEAVFGPGSAERYGR